MRLSLVRRASVVLATVTIVAGFGIDAAGASPGRIDNTFGTSGSGVVIRAANVAILRQHTGKIVTIGEDQNQVVTIQRYNTNGTLDTSFANGGTRLITPASGGSIFAATLQSDDKIVLAGDTNSFSD